MSEIGLLVKKLVCHMYCNLQFQQNHVRELMVQAGLMMDYQVVLMSHYSSRWMCQGIHLEVRWFIALLQTLCQLML